MAGLSLITSAKLLYSPILSVSKKANPPSRPRPQPLLSAPPPLNIGTRTPAFEFCSRRRWKSRGISVSTRARASDYIFALVVPLSMLTATIIASIRVADKLDQQFFEELMIEQSMLESEEDITDAGTSPNEGAESPPRRNRPKRQAETPSA